MDWCHVSDLDAASRLYVMETVPLPEQDRTILFDMIRKGPVIVSAKALSMLRKEELIEIMPYILEKPILRPFLVRACIVLGEEAESFVAEFLEDESEYVRKAALQIAGRLRLTGLEKKIRRMAEEERIARYAIAALKMMGLDISSCRNHKDEFVRALFDA